MAGPGPANDAPPVPTAVQIPFAIPQLYANAYENNANLSDLTVLFVWNNRPQAMVSMSLTVAKSCAMAILDLVSRVETDTKQKVFTLDELQQKVQQVNSGNPS